MFPELKTVTPLAAGTALMPARVPEMLPEFVMLALLKAWMPGEFPPVAATVPELVRLTVLAKMA